MKNIIITFFLFSLFCCQQKKTTINIKKTAIKKDKTEKLNKIFIAVNDTINSFFTNLKLDEMQYMPEMLYLGKKEQKTSVTFPTENEIEIAGFNIENSYSYRIKFEKGDSIFINTKNIVINEFKKVNFPIFEIPNSTKTWSEINLGYLIYKQNLKNKAIIINNGKTFGRNTFDFEKMYLNSITILDSLKANNSISDEFYLTNKINRKLEFATNTLRKSKNQSSTLNIDSLNIKLNDNELLNNQTYVDFLKTLIRYKYFNKDRNVSHSVQFDFINKEKTFLNESAKQILLDSYLKSIYFTEKQKIEKYVTKFNTINKSQELKNKWLSFIAKQKTDRKKLNVSNRNIGILTNLVNDNQLTFEEVLSTHKGKVVLVDFWASWCVPCRKEIPFLNKLKSKFSNSEFKIIEISIDLDYSSWVRASKLENLSNEEDSYIIANWKKSNLYKKFKINSIPRYLLFGKDGKIIDENAPRPSEVKLIELIKSSI